MERQIYLVDAYIVDSNGTFNHLDGYPKKFDSNSYQNDPDKAKKRAEGDMSEAWGAMCKNDVRQIQTVTLTDVFGFQVEKRSMGKFPIPEPEQNEEA